MPLPISPLKLAAPTKKTPDWQIRPTGDGSRTRGMNDVVRRLKLLTTPRVLGPRMRAPPAWARATISSCMARPASSASPKPWLTTMIAFTPASTHWATVSTTRSRGRLMTARSMGRGASPMDGQVLMPRISSAEGLMGQIFPGKP
jgi:hypothetical protein